MTITIKSLANNELKLASVLIVKHISEYVPKPDGSGCIVAMTNGYRYHVSLTPEELQKQIDAAHA